MPHVSTPSAARTVTNSRGIAESIAPVASTRWMVCCTGASPCGDRESKGCALVRGASECLALTGLRLFQAVAERPLPVHGLATQVNERMDVLPCRQDRR